jgi:hypothetical protein
MDRERLEHDLIDLLDGRLAPDRVGPLRAALAADPSLRALAEAMAADRRDIAALARRDESHARRDTAGSLAAVREAIEHAERQELLGSTRRASRRPRRVMWTPMAAGVAAVITVGLLAGTVTMLATRPSGDADARRAFKAEKIAPDADGEKHAAGTALAGAAAPSSLTSTAAEAPVGAIDEALAKLAGASDAPGERRSPDQALTELWSSEAAAQLRGDLAKGLLAVPSRAQLDEARARAQRTGEVSIDDAAVLAFAHRLRLVVRAPEGSSDAVTVARSAVSGHADHLPAARFSMGSEGFFNRTGPAASDVPASQATAAAASPDASWTVRVTAPLDAERTSLAQALRDLQTNLAAAGMPGARFELADDQPSAAIPATGLDDVLWWTRPPSAWGRAVTVPVDVRVEPAAGE